MDAGERGWRRRTLELRGELAAIAEPDPRWWLLAGGAALTERWPPRGGYLISDAEPSSDTFIGHAAEAPGDPVAHAIARVRAAREAVRALDGQLPEQPLAVTVQRDADGAGACVLGSALDGAAFAVGARAWWVDLALGDEAIAAALRLALTGGDPRRPGVRRPGDGPVPFVTAAIGDEPLGTARHGHRRGWAREGARECGPWLGLGRAGGLDVVSTCHLVVDGYGHARLAAMIHEGADRARRARDLHASRLAGAAPHAPLAPVGGGVPLGIAWRPLDLPAPRALRLAYALGCGLRDGAGTPFSPTLQIPVAPGTDELRWRRRVVPAAVSVRFADNAPEPFAAFDARARAVLAREVTGAGLCARLLAASRAVQLPLAWKRRAFSASRPAWLDRLAGIVGGRGCVSRMHLDAPSPPACAVSSPALHDATGGCVVTVIDDGARAAITLCGSGRIAGTDDAAAALLDELLARMAE